MFWHWRGRAYPVGRWQVCVAVQSATVGTDRPVVRGKSPGHPVPAALTPDRGRDMPKAHATPVAGPGARTLPRAPEFNAPFAEPRTVRSDALLGSGAKTAAASRALVVSGA